jgi:hypothetical protein
LRREYVEKSSSASNVVGEDEDGLDDAESTASLTELRKLRLEFWTAFKAWMEGRSSVRLQKAGPQSWMSMGIGRSGFHVSAVITTWSSASEDGDPEIRVQLVLASDQSKEHFLALAAQKETIQAKFKSKLHWHDIEGNKQRRIYVCMDADFRDRAEWSKQFEWLKEHLEVFSSVFAPLVRSL